MLRDRNGLTLHRSDRVIVNTGGSDTLAYISEVLEKKPFGPSAFAPAAMVVWANGKSMWMGGDVLTLVDSLIDIEHEED